MKSKPATKEQLVYFLHNQISLGTYDKRFIENLITSYVATLKPVTTNQSSLLDKITLRYERQLRKEEIDANEMVKLEWNVAPIPSLPKYTEAYVEIHDNEIQIRSPFKSEYIKQLKTIPLASWNSENRLWHIPANESTLKKVIVLTEEHYEKINYCDEIKHILNTIEELKSCQYWNPTLVKANGFFYIAAMNNALHEAIIDIPLNDELCNLARLVHHGVAISRSVLNDISKDITDDELLFAVETDLSHEADLESIIEKLTLVKADYVLLREWNVLAKEVSTKLKARLADLGIQVEILDKGNKPSIQEIKQAQLPVLISGYSFATPLTNFFAKTVGIKVSTPIEVK